MQSHTGGLNDNLRPGGDGGFAHPRLERGGSRCLFIDQLCQLPAPRLVAVDDCDGRCTRQGALHADGPGRAAGSQNGHPLAVQVHALGRQGLDKALAVGVLSHPVAAVPIDGVDGSNDGRRFRQPVQQGNHPDFMGHGQVEPVEVHGLGPRKSRFQVLSLYLHGDVPEVETFGGVGRLLHNAGGVAVHRIAEHAGEMGAIILFHGPCAPLSGFSSIVAQGVDGSKGDGVPVPLVITGQQQR